MSKQVFVADAILLASQLNTLQSNDFNQTVSTKTTSYVLVAADAGTKIVMNSASATTITVNTSLFAAGDTLTILNIAAGVCTVTAGTATVSTAGTLALVQNAGGTLYFTSAGVSVFQADGVAAGAGGKVLQVVTATTATEVTTTSTSYVTTGLTATITPSLASSKVLVLSSQAIRGNSSDEGCFTVFRGTVAGTNLGAAIGMGTVHAIIWINCGLTILDSPSTTSAQVYTIGMKNASGSGSLIAQVSNRTSTLTLLEIGA